MTQKTVGLIGWRGMVGSVLMQRFSEERDWQHFNPVFFSTSQVGQTAPDQGQTETQLQDAFDLAVLAQCDIIVTCQGGSYTERVYTPLRQTGWQGIWIDAASTLRMDPDSTIVLDPVNDAVIHRALDAGGKTFVGGNCTVSLLLLALKGLVAQDKIEWISAMTYQAVSGAGAQAMQTLLGQMQALTEGVNIADHALQLDQQVKARLCDTALPVEGIGFPLAGNVLPWIDSAVEHGQTREEWKAMVEANKILQKSHEIVIDGTCVRVGAMRSHAQALTVKLTEAIPLDEVESMVRDAHPWLRWVNNNRETTLNQLTPASVSGTLDIAVGRVRKLLQGPEYLNVFTVGDQLLWGAAEPLRCMLTKFF